MRPQENSPCPPLPSQWACGLTVISDIFCAHILPFQKIHPKWKEKRAERRSLRKPTKYLCTPSYLFYLFQLKRTYLSLMSQLESIVIKVFTVQALRLWANPRQTLAINKWGLYMVKHDLEYPHLTQIFLHL